MLDGKHDQEAMELPPDMPPPLAAGWDAELQMLVHEDEREFLASSEREQLIMSPE